MGSSDTENKFKDFKVQLEKSKEIIAELKLLEIYL